MTAPARDGGGLGRIGWPAAAALATGILGWVTMVAVARLEGPRDFAAFAVLWALFFGIGGALAGLQQEVTRAVRHSEGVPSTGATRVLPGSVVLAFPGAALAALLVAVSGVAPPATTWWDAAAMVTGLLALAVLVVLSGVLAARGAWPSLALLLVMDAVVRTLAVVGVTVAGRDDLLPWAIASGALAWVPALVSPRVRSAATARTAGGWFGFIRRSSMAMGSTACAALLVTGFPVLVSSARGGEDLKAPTGVLLATLVLVRSPLLVAVYGLRPSLLHAFITDPGTARRAVRWWGRIAAVGSAGTLITALAGPRLVQLVFGDRYTTGRLELTVLTAGSVQLAMLVVSGLALVALDRHLMSTAGWLVALAISVGVLALGGDQRVAILVSVLLGPTGGLLVHWFVLARADDRVLAPSSAAA